MNAMKQLLTGAQTEALLKVLQARFAANMHRHADIVWTDVQAKLEAYEGKLWSLSEMEWTGGEPDVTGYDAVTGEYLFCDCSPESPEGRRNLCYDDAALAARKANKPEGSAVAMAAAMGIKLLHGQGYQELQRLEAFDTKTSSWVQTPDEIRRLGGALFCDRRYDHVFLYHNGAESYYAARGFRGLLRV